MSWDDTHQTAADPDNPDPNEEITATEWNNMVADQKGHAARHESGGSDALSTLGAITADELDNAVFVNDIADLDQAIADLEPDRSVDGGGGIVFLAPPANPEDSNRPNAHFPDGVDNGNGRTVGVLGRTGVSVVGWTSPDYKRGPMQGGGQNPVVISARDLPEGTATSSGGDPRDWPSVLAPRPKIDGGQDRAVASQFRNIAITGEGKRVNGYYARNCDKGIVAGVNVADTVGFGFGWSGSFSMHGYNIGSEGCGSFSEGQNFSGTPFGTSEQNPTLTPGVPAVYAQEGQDTLSRNVNVRIRGFFQGSGDDTPTQILTGPGGTVKLIGEKSKRNGSVIRNTTSSNTTPRAVVDIAGNIVKNWNITGNGEFAILGAHIENDTQINDLLIEKFPEGMRFGNNPTNSPPIQGLKIQQISGNGTLTGDAIVVDNGASGDGKIPPIYESMFFDVGGDVVRYEDGNPGPIEIRDSVFDTVGGNIIQDNRGNASQDSRKELSGKANGITGAVSNNLNELAWVDLPSVFQNQFYDVISASNTDLIPHTMDVEPDLVQVTTESANVAGFSAKSASDVTLILEDGNGNAVTVDEPIHCAFRHASAMRQTRTDRTINS